MTTIGSGLGRLTELLYQAHCRVRQLCAFALPERHTVQLNAQGLLALGRFRVVETDTLDETAVAGEARVSHYHIEERALSGTPARKSNHHHDVHPQKAKRAILRRLFRGLQGKFEAP
jgi:hypothetical protein